MDDRRRSSASDIHRSVGVDPDFYDMVDDNILSILLNACKPLFDLVSPPSSPAPQNPTGKSSAVKPADLLMGVAKLIIAAGFKMKEQARQEMGEEDLGGGIFDEDVAQMKGYANRVVSESQVYNAVEQDALDRQIALHNAPAKSLRKHKTRTKLYTCALAYQEFGLEARMRVEIRAPPDQVKGCTGMVGSDICSLSTRRSLRTGWGTCPSI
jgi:hypothetical protein